VTLNALKLDPTLQSNGNSGPAQTLALLPGSPAIDTIPVKACSITFIDIYISGNPELISTDQRGNSRPDGAEDVCDVGAYESS